MSDLEKRVAETLAAHDFRLEYQNTGARFGTIVCGCGNRYGLSDSHRAHVAERINYALAPVIAEAQADLVDALADLMDDYQRCHDIAESAAYTEGETGRQSAIEAWECITEEPAEWLRKKAAEHRGHERDHLQELLFDAWQSGAEEAMDAAGYAQSPRAAMYDRNPYGSNDE